MSIVFLTLGVAFAAFCVWLAVRIVNRRERWAKWTAAGLLVGLPLVYIGSFGLACWITASPRIAGTPWIAGTSDAPRIWMRVYYPIGALIHSTQSQDSRAVVRWITWGAQKGGRVIVPIDASGNSWYGFTAE